MIQKFTNEVLARSPYSIPVATARAVLRRQQQRLIRDARTFPGGYVPNALAAEEEDDALG